MFWTTQNFNKVCWDKSSPKAYKFLTSNKHSTSRGQLPEVKPKVYFDSIYLTVLSIVAILDMDKAQIILVHWYKKCFNQECKIVVNALIPYKDSALLDTPMVLHVLDTVSGYLGDQQKEYLTYLKMARW